MERYCMYVSSRVRTTTVVQGSHSGKVPGFCCYSVNRYKPLQNQLLRKPLQNITNSYKRLQTSYSVNRYKLLLTVKNRY